MSIHSFTVQDARGAEKPLSDYKGRPLLIVNTASKCGNTPQYAGLQALYEKWRGAGLEILAFPCDQFGHQEPGTNDEIQQFCQLNYGVTFPVMAKIDVNGPDAHPLYRYLTGLEGREIGWNFAKFLVDADGNVVQRYEPKVQPEALEEDIQKVVGRS